MEWITQRGAGVFLACAWLCFSSVRTASGATSLSVRIAALTSSYERRSKAAVSLSVVDVRTGREITAHHPSVARAPASNQKILTSAFALARLGADYQISTMLIRRGDDLVVAGNFDPTFGDPLLAKDASTTIYADFDAWAAAVKKRVGARVAGDIVIASRRAGAGYRHEDWPENQYKRWYVAPVAEVNFNNNCFDVTFGLSGSQVTPHVSPASYLISVTNRVRRGSRQIWDLRISPDGATITVSGTVKAATNEPLSTAVNNPPLLFGRVLADRLKRAGVALGGTVRVVRPQTLDMAGTEVIAQKRTPLARALARANKRSLNMAAECAFLCAGDGTWGGSAKAMTSTLTKTFGVQAGDVTVRDGSGMSRKNLATSRAVTTVLARMLKHKGAGVLLDSLPRNGVDGTLGRRMTGRAYVGRVAAKTGYIAGVSALSGYVLDAEGKAAYAFSILVNRLPGGSNWQAKQFQDAVASALVDAVGGR